MVSGKLASAVCTLGEALFDALGDGDFAFAGQQLDRAHLAHVHAHGIGGAAHFGVDGREQRNGFFGGGFVVGGGAGGVVGQRIGIRRGVVHVNADTFEHRHDVFDLLRIDNVVGEVIVDLGVSQITLLPNLWR